MLQGGKEVGTATGFFYLANNTTYLVTNRHVVIDEAKGLKPDGLKPRLHSDTNDLSKNVDRILPLYEGLKPRWHVHKDYPRVPIDIAVIEVDPNLLAGTIKKALHRNSFFQKDKYQLVPGEDLVVVGFPRGVSDEKHNLGLMRNALLASAYGVDFNGLPMFLVDANLHPGMSGSPVLTKPRTVLTTKTGMAVAATPTTFFLGIFSSTVGAILSTGQQDPLGLGTVWHADLIEQILLNMRK